MKSEHKRRRHWVADVLDVVLRRKDLSTLDIRRILRGLLFVEIFKLSTRVGALILAYFIYRWVSS